MSWNIFLKVDFSIARAALFIYEYNLEDKVSHISIMIFLFLLLSLNCFQTVGRFITYFYLTKNTTTRCSKCCRIFLILFCKFQNIAKQKFIDWFFDAFLLFVHQIFFLPLFSCNFKKIFLICDRKRRFQMECSFTNFVENF